MNSASTRPQTSSRLSRRGLLIALAASATLPLLQGCFPVVAGGATAVAMMAADRRTSGSYVEDEGIEWRTRNSVSERFGSLVNVSVTSFNRNILLTGQVPDEATRSEIGRIAGQVTNVRGVVNELQVAGISSLSSRSNDAMITSKVRARFIDQALKNSHHVKVVTEASTVFLMGIVTQREAEAATEVARNTAGVQKVVRVFEYISEEEATRLDNMPRNEQQQ